MDPTAALKIGDNCAGLAAPTEPSFQWTADNGLSHAIGRQFVSPARGFWTPDLARDIGSRRWLAELAALIGLIAFALSIWPGMRASDEPARADSSQEREIGDMLFAVPALQAAAPHQATRPLLAPAIGAVPPRPTTEIYARLLQDETAEALLQRAGAGADEARKFGSLVVQAISPTQLEPGWRSRVVFKGEDDRNGQGVVQLVEVRVNARQQVRVDRSGGRFIVTEQDLARRQGQVRIRGAIGLNLTDTLLAAGLPPALEREFREALEAGPSAGNTGLIPGDRFDIVIATRPAGRSEEKMDRILFARLEREGRPVAQKIRWGGSDQFVSTLAEGTAAASPAFVWPVAGRLSSLFGLRQHPLLGYMRMHSGVDIAAPTGTPIFAAADGSVTMAGRSGGHGNHVRVAHNSSLTTAYSHLSVIAVSSGAFVRRGQLIGWVGSSGLATGPHLHYEVLRNGTPVDPHREAARIVETHDTAAQWKELDAQIAAFKALRPFSNLAHAVGSSSR